MKYILIFMILTGCIPYSGKHNSNSSSPSPKKSEDRHGVPESVGRFTDTETGVTCYYLYTHSISCLKLKKVKK